MGPRRSTPPRPPDRAIDSRGEADLERLFGSGKSAHDASPALGNLPEKTSSSAGGATGGGAVPPSGGPALSARAGGVPATWRSPKRSRIRSGADADRVSSASSARRFLPGSRLRLPPHRVRHDHEVSTAARPVEQRLRAPLADRVAPRRQDQRRRRRRQLAQARGSALDDDRVSHPLEQPAERQVGIAARLRGDPHLDFDLALLEAREEAGHAQAEQAERERTADERLPVHGRASRAAKLAHSDSNCASPGGSCA